MRIDIRQLFDKAIQTTAENEDYDYMITVEDSHNDTHWFQIAWDVVNAHYPFTEAPNQVFAQRGLVLPDGMNVGAWAAMMYLTLEHDAVNVDAIAAFVNAYLENVFGMDADAENWQANE